MASCSLTADDGTTGNELWISDGTATGTQLLVDINPGISPYSGLPAGAYASDFTEFDGQLLFAANDGTTGRELWVSDGTAAGTQLLVDINPGSFDGGYPAGSFPFNFTEIDGQLFFTANDGTTGDELWVSDGTAAGTQLLLDIDLGSSGSYASNLTEFDGQLFFTADNGITGDELWVSDGTVSGTQRLVDITSIISPYGGYLSSSYASDLTVAGDLLFFTANDGFNGQELWVSDGSIAGTQLFQDINPGSGGSYPDDLTVVGNQLFFSASDGTSGTELWVTSIPNLISGDDDNNTIDGTADDDLINGLGGDDFIFGQAGDDIINGGDDSDFLFGNTGDDIINGDAGFDQLFGDEGDDILIGGTGDDILDGGLGDDTVIVNDFSDLEFLSGGPGFDTIQFEPTDGRDLTIFLDLGAVGDGLVGGQFFENFEQIMTGSGDDQLLGDAQDTILEGREGNDDLQGAAGQDTLIGGQGADTLEGGTGDDILLGEAGADTFVFDGNLLDGVAETDTIQGVQVEDTFDFTGYLAAGGSIGLTRLASEFLRIDLSNEDVINVFGSPAGLDAAEAQLLALNPPPSP